MKSKFFSSLPMAAILFVSVFTFTGCSKEDSEDSGCQESQMIKYDIAGLTEEQIDPHVNSAIENAKTGQVNFNHHYVTVIVGCGTACGIPAIYDKNTGNLYRFNSEVLDGAVSMSGDADIISVTSNAQTNIIGVAKEYSNGGSYFEYWKLIDEEKMQLELICS